jgi:uncharacterized membrane protein
MITRRQAVALVRVLLVGIGIAPFVAPAFDQVSALGGLAETLHAWFGFQCERDPARMFAFGAVCARCLGIYAGMVLGGLGVGQRLTPRRLELGLGLAAIAMVADVASEVLGWRPAWAPIRVGTGLLLGLSGTAVAVGALRTWAQNPYANPSAG